MGAAYDSPVDLDLSVARERIVIDSTVNAPVGFITIITLPAGADVGIHMGTGGKRWPLKNQGQFFKICPPIRTGIYVSNPVGGGTLQLGISFDNGPETGGQ